MNYSSWAAPILVVKKQNGNVRICADFSTALNAALESHQYPLPLPNDLFVRLNDGKSFAKLDLSDACVQADVSKDPQELLTINIHRGLLQNTRLPFGVKTAPAVFQLIIDTVLQDVPSVAAYLDDIIIMGADPVDLENRIENMLYRIQDCDFRLREEKCLLHGFGTILGIHHLSTQSMTRPR